MADLEFTPLKKCTSCGEAKPATPEYFHAYKRSPDGRRSVCKECRAAKYAENREEERLRRRIFYSKNSERIAAEIRKNYANNPEPYKEAARARYWRNREKNVARSRAYMEKNREALNAKKREYSKRVFESKYKIDPYFTLRHRVSALLRKTITSSSDKAGRRLEEILGYSIDEFRDHMEKQFTKGMNWDAFMNGDIHIDHIIPISELRPTKIDSDEFRACWCLSNLRPIWSKENLSKGSKVLTLL